MEAWMKALACASYDYMKLMVSELQRQLDEIVELEKAHASIFDDPKPRKTLGASAGIFGGHLVAPPRQAQPRSRSRRSASQPKNASPMVNQRLNPFDRDVVVGNVKQHEQLQEWHLQEQLEHLYSAPSAPQSIRHTSAERNCNSNEVYGVQPSRRLEHSMSQRSESPQGVTALTMTSLVTMSLSHLCHPFLKLHELYGAKIMSDVHSWSNKKNMATSDENSVLMANLVNKN